MKLARFWEKSDGNKVKCELCPNYCLIDSGKRGSCGVRINKEGKLFSEIYGEITSLALDPIEKKPLYHYHPGENILSIGTKGCNFHCGFCQNWGISQDLKTPTQPISSVEVVKKAKDTKSFGIAYTYNEPFIWYEFVYDTATIAKENKLENILVTNGYVNQKPLDEILPLIDAMNIDVKSMREDFYLKICKGKLRPILETAKKAKRHCHVEITNLIIPTLNDSEEDFIKLSDWIKKELGSDTPLHFSRYFPCYKFDIPPTPLSTLKTAEEIAKRRLKHVYLGNI
ncbi:MAG: AmmeMemoRadiSam system radical SAM enzyme [Candidatus Omnitrophica bacterium]|nr:AmmeMemoRadiSam system radical SAM enzyme [Candidatus Omnitrophota bacterium]